MIVDSSVVVAILKQEPEAIALIRRMRASRTAPRISAANYLETGIVIDALADQALSDAVDRLLEDIPIEIVPVTAEHARIAREAHRRFGRRSGNPAKLNFGDCFAYALARSTGEPLLFKGDDFSSTDVVSA